MLSTRGMPGANNLTDLKATTQSYSSFLRARAQGPKGTKKKNSGQGDENMPMGKSRLRRINATRLILTERRKRNRKTKLPSPKGGAMKKQKGKVMGGGKSIGGKREKGQVKNFVVRHSYRVSPILLKVAMK